MGLGKVQIATQAVPTSPHSNLHNSCLAILGGLTILVQVQMEVCS